jgi:hypothetical protein
MTHFTTEQWIDFVNEAISAEAKQDMKRHLQQGCESCSQKMSLWLQVRNVARSERTYQPPAGTLRMAQAAFATSSFVLKRKGAFTLAEVVFDSFLQPAVEGARSLDKSTRQVLYRADPYQIDVQIEVGSNGNTLVVTGQVIDLRQPGLAGGDLRVAISNLRGPVEQTTTNQFGEFRKEISDSGDLELVFPGLGNKPVIISLRDPLGRLSKETHPHAPRNSKVHRKVRKKT